MSFTSLEIVRKHILEKHLGINRIDSEPIQLLAENHVRVAFPPIQNGTEIVKAITRIKPNFQMISFESSQQVTLSEKPIVKDTVVIASDSSLGLVYQENLDYIVDYAAGIVTRIPTGAITSTQNLIIWYLPYRVYIKDIDYQISYTKGEVARLSDGAINSGQSLEIDYVSEFGIVDDDVINNAINEANEAVLNYIDNSYINSVDKSLVIGETYLAIAILCRIKAVESVSAGISENLKSSWLAIADQYKNEAYSFLGKFAAAVGSLAIPQKG